MIDFLFQATVNNLIVSASLALIAWIVQSRVRSASLANLLWALVLIKLVTPPLFCLPVVELPRISVADDEGIRPRMVSADIVAAVPSSNESSNNSDQVAGDPAVTLQVVPALLMTWLTSSIALLLVSAFRIARFHRSLVDHSRFDSTLTERLGQSASRRLGLAFCPPILVTAAHIAPFVWWSRGRTVVVLPQNSIEALSEDDLHYVVTHELAHVKRRDHWFRWLEWLAMIAFWWNPIMWLAHRQLRIAEEMACDDLVLRTKPGASAYANSLLNMAELLATRAVRPPVVASAVNSGGNLERRLEMILSKQSWQLSSLMRMTIATTALCVFPLGFVYAQDLQSVERRLGGAVEAGEMTLDEASLMLDTLRKARETDDPVVKAWHGAWKKDRKATFYEFAPDQQSPENEPDEEAAEGEKKANVTGRYMFVPDGGQIFLDVEEDSQEEESVPQTLKLRLRQLIEKKMKGGKLLRGQTEGYLNGPGAQEFESDEGIRYRVVPLSSDKGLQGYFRLRGERKDDSDAPEFEFREDSEESAEDDASDDAADNEVRKRSPVRYSFRMNNKPHEWRYFRFFDDGSGKGDADEKGDDAVEDDGGDQAEDDSESAQVNQYQSVSKALKTFSYYLDVIR